MSQSYCWTVSVSSVVTFVWREVLHFAGLAIVQVNVAVRRGVWLRECDIAFVRRDVGEAISGLILIDQGPPVIGDRYLVDVKEAVVAFVRGDEEGAVILSPPEEVGFQTVTRREVGD